MRRPGHVNIPNEGCDVDGERAEVGRDILEVDVLSWDPQPPVDLDGREEILLKLGLDGLGLALNSSEDGHEASNEDGCINQLIEGQGGEDAHKVRARDELSQ